MPPTRDPHTSVHPRQGSRRRQKTTVNRNNPPPLFTRVSRPPPPPSLPILRIPLDPELATTVEVNATPERIGTRLTWTVERRPERQIGRDDLIILTAGRMRSGIGRALEVTEFQRHWITWSVSGGPGPCCITIPTSWSRFQARERILHFQLYQTLPHTPEPHPLFRDDQTLTQGTEYPYEFEQDPDPTTEPPAPNSPIANLYTNSQWAEERRLRL
ncbi:uncharacterized protein C8Q71DRAFT_861910 [Rhodofomes roseus]|uniref:Uncharacterized protein n=1 Tax=Rhodofomes roseus TaxID=34475 RepID=A0ABQ8K480_9APHY|nr:uncharacterized protein C8Q71DRAFT_861910 [Rhodofomes roseus]KAH9831176.1 hypothetical protein C8Q71DRAFT_861910 [Rhodofomes roseus]